jgi:hypothetical protein
MNIPLVQIKSEVTRNHDLNLQEIIYSQKNSNSIRQKKEKSFGLHNLQTDRCIQFSPNKLMTACLFNDLKSSELK